MVVSLSTSKIRADGCAAIDTWRNTLKSQPAGTSISPHRHSEPEKKIRHPSCTSLLVLSPTITYYVLCSNKGRTNKDQGVFVGARAWPVKGDIERGERHCQCVPLGYIVG